MSERAEIIERVRWRTPDRPHRVGGEVFSVRFNPRKVKERIADTLQTRSKESVWSGLNEVDLKDLSEPLVTTEIFSLVGDLSEFALGRDPEGNSPEIPRQHARVGIITELVLLADQTERDFAQGRWCDGAPLPEILRGISFSKDLPRTQSGLAAIIFRSLETASLCRVCEQADGWTGLLVHAWAAVMGRKLKVEEGTKPSGFDLWRESYAEAISELASPVNVGLVDILIEQCRRDKGVLAPRLHDFFKSSVAVGDFEGTYFDMTEGMY